MTQHKTQAADVVAADSKPQAAAAALGAGGTPPPAADAPPKAPEKPAAKGWTLHPSYATMTGFVIVLVITTLWVFVLGFMAGKGQNLQQKLQQLTGLETSPPVRAAAEQPKPQADKGKEPTAQAVKSAGTAPAEGAKPAADVRKEQQNAQAPQEKAAPQFAFVYQIAAFKINDTEGMDKVRKALSEAGYRTKMEKRGTLGFVLVHLRGSEEDAAALRAQCKKLKLGSPLLRTKATITDRKKK